MNRGPTGRFEVVSTAGEQVRAFVPAPLPPEPALDLAGERQLLLERALLACGRLDGVSALLPDPDLFLYAYVRREAVLSSQIEGTQSSLSALLLFELDEAPGVPFDDVLKSPTTCPHSSMAWRGCVKASRYPIGCCAKCTENCLRAAEVPKNLRGSSEVRKTGSVAPGRPMPNSFRRRPPRSKTA